MQAGGANGGAMPKAMVTERNGEISCSVEETNRIRAALGLKPLNMGASASQRREAEAQETHKRQIEARKRDAAAADMAAALAKSRERRERHSRLKGKTLGEQLTGGGATSAADWVKSFKAPAGTDAPQRGSKRKRKGRGQKRGREGEAARTARLLAEQDAEYAAAATSGGVGARKKLRPAGADMSAASSEAYTAKELAGLKVQHGSEAFASGSSVVLTLKDTSVLDGDGDELHNVNMAEDDARRRHAREAGRTRPAYIDGDVNPSGEASMVLTADGLATDSGAVAEEKAQAAFQASRHGTKVSLDGKARTLASDYLTREEMEGRSKGKKHKKKKKQRKLRKRKRDKGGDGTTMPPPDGGGGGDGGDHGSRRRGGGAAVAAQREREQAAAADKSQAYAAAITKEKGKVSALLRDDGVRQKPKGEGAVSSAGAGGDGVRSSAGAGGDGVRENVRTTAGFGFGAAGTIGASSTGHRKYNFGGVEAGDLDAEEDDAELAESLARARRLAKRKARKAKSASGAFGVSGGSADVGGHDVAAAVAALKDKQRNRAAEAKQSGKGIVFTSTSEFSRSIHSRMNEKRRDDAAMAVERANAAAVARARAALQAAKKGLIAARGAAGSGTEAVSSSVAAEGDASGSATTAEVTSAGAGVFAAEPLASGGMADTLRLMRRNGQAFTQVAFAGRDNDARMSEKDVEELRTGVKIEHRDELTGQLLTPKEAFRQQSYKFHGTAPGKKKQEKKLKKLLEEYRVRSAATGDTPLGMNAALRNQQHARGQAFVVLNRGGR